MFVWKFKLMLVKASRLYFVRLDGALLETMSLTKQKNFQGSSPIELAVVETLITSKKKSSIRTGFSNAVFCLLSCCVRECVQPLTLPQTLS